MTPDATPAPEHRAPWGFRIAAVALGCALALLVAEVVLRVALPQPTAPSHLVTDPDVGVRPRPGMSGTVRLPGVYTYRFSHDAEGFRSTPAPDGATPPEASGGTPQVMILGDSFAYGMGVNDDETAASALARGLAERGTPAEVVNAARIGAGPGYALRLLQTRGQGWQPDVAVYLFYVNDYANLQHATYFDADSAGALTPVPPRDGPRQLKTRLSQIPGARTLQAHSHVAGLVRRLAVSTLGDTGPQPSLYDLDTLRTPIAYSEPYRAWLAEAYFRALKAEVESRGGRLLAFYLPSAAEVAAYRRTGESTADAETFEAILRRLGIDGQSLTGLLAARPEPIAALYYPEIHWRPLGHRVAARAMLDPVQAALCVKDAGLRGCATAPADVRRIVGMRGGSGSGE